MKLKGNYYLLFSSQLLTGIVTYFACIQFGISGVVIGFIPFLIGMLVVLVGHIPDEREMDIMHKSNSYVSIIVATLMAIVYLFFPELNWFFIFVASISLVRGTAGLILCAVK